MSRQKCLLVPNFAFLSILAVVPGDVTVVLLLRAHRIFGEDPDSTSIRQRIEAALSGDVAENAPHIFVDRNAERSPTASRLLR